MNAATFLSPELTEALRDKAELLAALKEMTEWTGALSAYATDYDPDPVRKKARLRARAAIRKAEGRA